MVRKAMDCEEGVKFHSDEQGGGESDLGDTETEHSLTRWMSVNSEKRCPDQKMLDSKLRTCPLLLDL